MSGLAALLQERREELLGRIMQRVGQAGYLGAVSSARFDWAEVIGGLEQALCAGEAMAAARAEAGEDPPAAGDPAGHPAVMMGTMLAQRFRPRGVSLRLLIGISQVSRAALLDVLNAHPDGLDLAPLLARVSAHFDRMVLALCQEWTEGEGADAAVRELTQAARVQTEDKTRFIGILESLGSPVFLLGVEGRIEYCNPSAWLLFGRDLARGTMSGRPIVEIAPEVAVALAALDQAGRDEATVERRLDTRQGVRHMDVRMSRVRDARRQVSGSVIVLNDVTLRRDVEEALRQARAQLEERVRERTDELEQANEALRGEVRDRVAAETVLRESEGRYRSLVNLSPDGIIVHSEGIVVFANASARRMMGLPEDDTSLVGAPVLDFVHPDDRHAVVDRVRTMVMTGGRVPPLEERFVRQDGAFIPVEVNAAGIVWEGRPSVQVVFRDIGERVRQRREADERARSMEVLLEAQDRISRADPGTAGGLVADALAGASGAWRAAWFAVDPTEGLLRFEAGFNLADVPALVETARAFRFAPGQGDDFVNQAAVSRDPIYVPDCHAEPRWRRLEDQTRSAVFLPVRFRDRLFGVALLMSTDLDGFPASRRVQAVVAADYLGAALESAVLHARTREAESRFRSIFENAVEGIYQCLSDGRVLAANPALARMLGHEDPRDLLVDPSDFLERLHANPRRREDFLRELQQQGLVQGFEYEARRADGQRVWVSESARALRDATGALVRWEGVIEDVSRRKELESQLQQAQKMEAVGRLAGGVAHDFNNLLTAILGYSGMLLDRLDPGDPAWRDVGEIREAGRRAAALTGQLLAFSRKQILQPAVLDLNEVVAGIDKLLRRLIGEDIDLVTRAASLPVRIQADPGQLDQVLVNLAVNSRDAMPHGGRLTIEVGPLDLPDVEQAAPLGLTPGRYALLAVTDTGSGMDEETRSHLFEPFFTTKGPGKGTGLGLAVVYGIVKQSGGHIWCESAPGQGTCMRVCLPRVLAPDAVQARSESHDRVTRGSETVLVAEDEAAVRGLVRVVLEGAGYRVVEARDGREALEAVSRLDGPLHLLLSDVVMPGMNGRDLARMMRRMRPALRVLFTSGYTDSVIVEPGLLGPGSAFLQKPFSPTTLLEVVRDLLDHPVEQAPEDGAGI